MKNTVYVYHHNDADGLGSAAVIYKYLKKKFDNYSKVFHMCSHKPDELLPLETFKSDDIVFVVDYAVPVDYARSLIEIGVDFIWIDHHKSAIENYEEFEKNEYEIQGLRNYTDYESAIKLCWKWCFPKEKIPQAIELVSDYDSWKWSINGNTDAKYFVYGLEIEDVDPIDGVWEGLFDGIFIESIIDNGIIIDQYKKITYEDFVENSGYDVEFEGYSAKVLNAQRATKQAFVRYFDKYDIFIGWSFTGSKYVFSLYTNNPNIDIGTICKKYGGGGHPGAGGFTINELPF